MVYTIEHKIFLQAMLQRGIMHDTECKQLLGKLFTYDVDIKAIIREINNNLQFLNMAIKARSCEISGDTHWGLLYTNLDAITKFQIEFSKSKLVLLNNVFTEIITSKNGYASSTKCLNLCNTSDMKLSIGDAEAFLNTMVEKKWLFLKDGQYHIGIHSIIELEAYFKTTYADYIKTCSFCTQLIYYGTKCLHCDSMIHLHCLKNYKMCQLPLKCHKCNHIMIE